MADSLPKLRVSEMNLTLCLASQHFLTTSTVRSFYPSSTISTSTNISFSPSRCRKMVSKLSAKPRSSLYTGITTVTVFLAKTHLRAERHFWQVAGDPQGIRKNLSDGALNCHVSVHVQMRRHRHGSGYYSSVQAGCLAGALLIACTMGSA